jgi:hypothetical protein
MEIGLSHLSAIGYILPWKLPRTGKPTAKLLEDEEAYKTLIKNIFLYIDEQQAKRKGKGVVKPFTIQIVDTSAPADAKVSSFNNYMYLSYIIVPEWRKTESSTEI